MWIFVTENKMWNYGLFPQGGMFAKLIPDALTSPNMPNPKQLLYVNHLLKKSIMNMLKQLVMR
jgi:hypothetical protein